jgi:SAM-dependent methyltransferase
VSAIADSSAMKDARYVLPQHQAAITLLQARLSDPACDLFGWLDLACGRGQIIAALNDNLTPEARSHLAYWGYDINQEYVRETRAIADSLGLATVDTRVCDLRDFGKILPQGTTFDFVTLTNTVHEVNAADRASVLVDAILRLSPDGTLFVYDMESIRPPELGAVPWSRDEARSIVYTLLEVLGVDSYRPEVGLWHHRSCDAWNVLLERQHLKVSDDQLAARRETAISALAERIKQLLVAKLELCRTLLESLTLKGAETSEEQNEKQRLLYEYWAVSRALGGGQ